MRSRFDLLNGPALRAQAAAALDAFNAAMRQAADELAEEARNAPAPCGCTPKVRCDRHCRARVTSYRGAQGYLAWLALCDGGGMHKCPAAKGDLDRVHRWATAHIAEHRTAALDRAHNHEGGTR